MLHSPRPLTLRFPGPSDAILVEMMVRRLIHIWKELNAPCEHMSLLASRSMDERLPRLSRFAYRLHLLYCRACRRYVRHLRQLRGMFRTAASAIERSEPTAGPALSPAARDRISSALRGSRD